MSGFISFKEFHKNTNLSYQQLLRDFHKARGDKHDPLSEDIDYRYEGKDIVRGRTGILFVNPVLLYPKLKNQRATLTHVQSDVIPDETLQQSEKIGTTIPNEIGAVSSETIDTEVKPSESRETKQKSEQVVSDNFEVIPDETASNSTLDKMIDKLTDQLEAKDRQIAKKDEQVKDLTTAITGMEANRFELQQQLKKANEVVLALSSGGGVRGNESEIVDAVPEGTVAVEPEPQEELRQDDDQQPTVIYESVGEGDTNPPESVIHTEF